MKLIFNTLPNGLDDQEKLLAEAIGTARKQAFQMNLFLDKVRMLDALKCASTMHHDELTKVLGTTTQILDSLEMNNISHFSTVNQELSRLLRICIDFYNNALTIIKLSNFCPLLEKFACVIILYCVSK